MVGRPATASSKAGLNFTPEDDLIEPLDYLILGVLPDQGTMFAGAYLDGKTSKQLSEELFEGKIKASTIGPRMNALHYHGLVNKSKGIGTSGRYIYQRTARGIAVHREWANKQAAKNESGDHE